MEKNKVKSNKTLANKVSVKPQILELWFPKLGSPDPLSKRKGGKQS